MKSHHLCVWKGSPEVRCLSEAKPSGNQAKWKLGVQVCVKVEKCGRCGSVM